MIEINTELQDRLLNEWFDTVTYIDAEDDEWDDSGTGVDEKGIRYVRTPEGARRYGQPIGTPIIADGVGNPLSHAVDASVAPVASPRAIQPSTGASGRPRPSRGMQWVDSWNGMSRAKHRNYSLTASRKNEDEWEWDVFIRFQNGRGDLSVDTVASGVTKEKDGALAKKAAERAAKKREKEWQNRNPRDFENLMDYWPGVAHHDYDPDNRDRELSEPEVQMFYENPTFRQTRAEEHTRKMGIQIKHDTSIPLEINAHEMINATLQAHEDMFPGFNKLIGSIGTSGMEQFGSDANRVLAYNGTRDPYSGMHTKTELRFNWRYFGDHDRVYEKAKEVSSLHDGNTWHSVDGPSFMEENAEYFDDWLMSMMQTTVHELGHTLGNIALGNFDETHEKVNERMTKTQNDIWTLFYNWGIIDTEMTEEEFRREMAVNISNRGGNFAPFMKFKRGVIHEVLSNYGATSIHEMFAESWAEYLLDPNPRDFSVAVGELLTEFMQDYLEDYS